MVERKWWKRLGYMAVSLIMAVSLCMPSAAWGKEAKKSGYDTEAPKALKVTIKNPSVTKPGFIQVVVEAKEEETGIIGIDVGVTSKKTNNSVLLYHGGLWTNGENQQDGEWMKSPRFSGKYTLNIPVSSKIPSGEYRISSVWIADQAGNMSQYYIDDSQGTTQYLVKTEDGNEKCYINNASNTINIKDEFDVDFQYFINNPNIVSKLKAMQTGKVAMINFSNSNYTAKKAFFDAIKGKDKTIVFSNDGIQWVFNGKNINKATKNINLKTKVKRESGREYGTSDNVVSLMFASNGTLPGRARVRLKTDYVLSSRLNLYYLDDGDLDLESSKAVGYADGSDTWSEIYLTHNSKFLLSKSKLISSPKKLKLKTLKRKKLKVSWAKIKGIKKYQIVYSTSKKFTKKTTKKVTVTGSSKTLKKLKAKKRYYVKVRAVKNSKTFGVYCKAKRSGKIRK